MASTSFTLINNSSNYTITGSATTSYGTTTFTIGPGIEITRSTTTGISIKLSNCYFDDSGSTYRSYTSSSSKDINISPYFKVVVKSESNGSVNNPGTFYFKDYYSGGSDHSFVATPNDYYKLTSWTSDNGSDPYYKLTIPIRPDRNETWTANFEKVTYNFTYDPGDCTMGTGKSSVSGGASLTLPSLKKSKYTESVPVYTVSYIDTLDTSGSTSRQSVPGTTVTEYSNFYWIGSNGGTYYPGDTFTPSSSINFTAHRTATPTITKNPKVGDYPSMSTVSGYTNKGWYTTQDTSGEKISTTIELYGNKTFYAVREGKTYNIYFKQSPSSGVDWGESGIPSTMQKVFGTNIGLFPQNIPERKGYEFVGWASDPNTKWYNEAYKDHDPADIRAHSDWWNSAEIIRPTDTVDSISSKLDSISKTGANIYLYTIWRPINHFIVLHWYIWDDKPTYIEKKYMFRYTIEDVVATVYAPAKYKPDDVIASDWSMLGDWVFYGYKQYSAPGAEDESRDKEWSNVHGVYRTLDKTSLNILDSSKLPFTYSVKNDSTWEEQKETVHIYGFWTITGKYVNVDGEWKRIVCAYIRESSGTWTPMNGLGDDDPTSFSVNIDNNWKKEVH